MQQVRPLQGDCLTVRCQINLRRSIRHCRQMKSGVSMHAGLVMGKHSGSAALRQRLKDLGFADLPKDQVADIFTRFKKVLQLIPPPLHIGIILKTCCCAHA